MLFSRHLFSGNDYSTRPGSAYNNKNIILKSIAEIDKAQKLKPINQALLKGIPEEETHKETEKENLDNNCVQEDSEIRDENDIDDNEEDTFLASISEGFTSLNCLQPKQDKQATDVKQKLKVIKDILDDEEGLQEQIFDVKPCNGKDELLNQIMDDFSKLQSNAKAFK
jgi:hypothetical protein